MTSTSIKIGFEDNPRASSRVLRPPGGGHTDIFGGEIETPRSGRRAAPADAAANASSFSTQSDEPKQAASAEPPAQNGRKEPAPVPEPPQEPVRVEAPKQCPQPQEPARGDAPKRVRVPPGGFSSGLW